MEILSDATFRGNISINGGNFYVTNPGNTSHVIEITGNGAILIHGTETIYGALSLV